MGATAKPALAAQPGGGSQRHRGAEGCTTEIFPVIVKGRYKGRKSLAGRSCTSFGHRSSTEPLLGLP